MSTISVAIEKCVIPYSLALLARRSGLILPFKLLSPDAERPLGVSPRIYFCFAMHDHEDMRKVTDRQPEKVRVEVEMTRQHYEEWQYAACQLNMTLSDLIRNAMICYDHEGWLDPKAYHAGQT